MSSITAEKPPLGELRNLQKEQQNNMTLGEARRLKADTEMQIAQLLTRYEVLTGCMICDIGHWHHEFAAGVERVEVRVELK